MLPNFAEYIGVEKMGKKQETNQIAVKMTKALITEILNTSELIRYSSMVTYHTCTLCKL